MKAIMEKLTSSFGTAVDVPLTGWALDSEKTSKQGGAHLYFVNEITGDRKISYGGDRWHPYDEAWLAESEGLGIIHRALGTDIYTKEEMAPRSAAPKP